MSSTHSSRADDARQEAARASNPRDRRHPRETPSSTPPGGASARDRGTRVGADTPGPLVAGTGAHRREGAPDHVGRRETGKRKGAAADDDALDAVAREAMAAGDPPASPASPALSRSRG